MNARVFVAVAVAMCLAGCGSSGDVRTAVPTTTPPRPAEPAGFSATTSGQGCGATVRWVGSSGGTGVIFGHFSLAASPGRVCRFRGLPDVRLLDAAGDARPTRSARDRLVTSIADYRKTVEIRAGHGASFSVVYSDHLPSGRACRRAFGIDVRLPGSRLHDRVPVDPTGTWDDHHSFNPCGSAVAVTAIRPDDLR